VNPVNESDARTPSCLTPQYLIAKMAISAGGQGEFRLCGGILLPEPPNPQFQLIPELLLRS
jgi:hypothetical protein